MHLHQQAGPSSPVVFLGPCHSPLVPTGVAEISPIQGAASALRESPSDRSAFTHYPGGGRVISEPDATDTGIAG